MEEVVRFSIRVRGVVQGVGFRPFIYREARARGLSGFVFNDSDGVLVEAEGNRAKVKEFVRTVKESPPPLARVDSVEVKEIPPEGSDGFEIRPSPSGEKPLTLVSPDLATCGDCLRELFDPEDRRFLYPFINCTNCGPRYTIVKNLPYDRPNTTMGEFTMCGECRKEYEDPTDRRFHAQPAACPAAGPRVWLSGPDGETLAERDAAVSEAARLLWKGGIAALKGLGGFHLAADASDEDAVRRLRERKRREKKPFALMCADMDVLRSVVFTDAESERLLSSFRAPIVLLPRRPGADVAEAAAPGRGELGVMLPYTPLHHLLLKRSPPVLVMTSGNISEEPIAHRNEDALERLRRVADAFLLHDRKIHVRVDDSVLARRSFGFVSFRRSRGYAPLPVKLGRKFREVLAFGPHLKNTVTYLRGEEAFMSHHVGDLENTAALSAFRQAVRHLAEIYRFRPEAAACDLHPSYASTTEAERFARERGVPLFRVQHHHAHGLAAAAEKGHWGRFLAVAWDGTGYGPDGAVWGMEFLVCEGPRFRRAGRLEYAPVAGGDRTIRVPARTAFFLAAAHLGGDEALRLAPSLGMDEDAAGRLLAAAGSSAAVPVGSCGRLFDAAAALCGVCLKSAYEGQAAVEFEAAAEGRAEEENAYPFPVREEDGTFVLEPGPLLSAVAGDVARGAGTGKISRRFHGTLVKAAVETVLRVLEGEGTLPVALCGGCFQNRLLLEGVRSGLAGRGLEVLVPSEFPPNDGAVSLGQAVAAALLLEERDAG